MQEKLIYHSLRIVFFRLIGTLVVSTSFLISGMMFWKDEQPISGLLFLILGIGLGYYFIYLLVRLLTSTPYLRLTKEGFYHTANFRQQFTAWSEVKKVSYNSYNDGDGSDICDIEITLLNGKTRSIDLTLLGITDDVRKQAFREFSSYYRSYRPKKAPIQTRKDKSYR